MEDRMLDPDWKPYPVGYDEAKEEILMDKEYEKETRAGVKSIKINAKNRGGLCG